MPLPDHTIENTEFSPFKWATHFHQLLQLAEGRDILPITVEVDLVGYCNHNCGWCVDPVHFRKSMSRTFVSDLLKELRSLGVEGIVFKGGGEPTLYKAFPEVLEEACSLGFETGIVTNGSRLTNIYEAVVDNASYIRMSIDGPTPESHKLVHRSSDFSKILKGAGQMITRRNQLLKRHPIIGFSFAMEYELIGLVSQAIQLGCDLEADYVLFRPPFFEEVGRKNTMTFEQKRALLAAFERECQGYSGPMKVFIDYWISDAETDAFCATGESPRRGQYLQPGANGIEHATGCCLATPLLAVVTADQKIYPCCNLRFLKGWDVGTIDYEQGLTFLKVWQGQQRKETMERIHRAECLSHCTHPLSRYNEIIEYLKGPQHHRGFV